MPYDYSEDVAFAVESVAEYGRDITFFAVRDAIDPANPLGAPLPPDESDPVKAAFMYPTGVTNLGFNQSVAELLKSCAQVALVAPSAVDYEAMTHIRDFDGSIWVIATLQKFMPGDTALLYYVGVNRP